MFLLRPAARDDLPALLELARHLDSPNLPYNEEFLNERLERSAAAFAEPGPPSPEREYQLMLEDGSGAVVGTSAIISKHGTAEMPHTYLQVSIEERRSETVDVCVRHCTLKLGSSRDGPSEIGSLVLLPETRGQSGWPGKLLSWGRFAFMALHPDAFERQVLAEMRASLDSEGRNAFWDAFGKRFTDMSYAEADRLSATDKGFILDLFPETPFYTTLLPERVVNELGQVHPEARPAMRLLESAGLYWIGEIDPFDAGPFVGAATSEVIPIRDTVLGRLAGEPLAGDIDAGDPFIASSEAGERGFRAVATHARMTESGEVELPVEAAKRLGVAEGAEIFLTPLPASTGGARRG